MQYYHSWSADRPPTEASRPRRLRAFLPSVSATPRLLAHLRDHRLSDHRPGCDGGISPGHLNLDRDQPASNVTAIPGYESMASCDVPPTRCDMRSACRRLHPSWPHGTGIAERHNRFGVIAANKPQAERCDWAWSVRSAVDAVRPGTPQWDLARDRGARRGVTRRPPVVDLSAARWCAAGPHLVGEQHGVEF